MKKSVTANLSETLKDVVNPEYFVIRPDIIGTLPCRQLIANLGNHETNTIW